MTLKMNSKIAKIEVWLVVHKKPLTQAVKRLLPACALFRCMSTFLRMLCRMAQHNSSTKQNKNFHCNFTNHHAWKIWFAAWTRRMKKNCWRHRLQWNVHNGKLIGASEVVGRKKSVGFNPRIIARAIMMTSHPVVLFRLRNEKRLICCWKTKRAKSLQNCEHQCLWKAIKRQKQIKLSNFDSPDHLQGREVVVILYNSVVLIRL